MFYVLCYVFMYKSVFIYSSLHGFLWNQRNDQLLIGITEVIGSNLVRPDFFSGLIFTSQFVLSDLSSKSINI